jgi:hypothetical protein
MTELKGESLVLLVFLVFLVICLGVVDRIWVDEVGLYDYAWTVFFHEAIAGVMPTGL